MHFIWIVGAVLVVGSVWLAVRLRRAWVAAELVEEQRQAEIRARADQQQAWRLAGDDRGLYGPVGAELMRVVRR